MRKETREIAISFVIASAAFTACTALKLSSTEQHTIILASGQTDYGVVDVGHNATHTFTVSPNTTMDDDTISKIQFHPGDLGCNVFSMNPTGLPAEVYYSSGACVVGSLGPNTGVGSGFMTECDYSFDVTFAPTQQGMVSCTVDIMYSRSDGTGGVSVLPLLLTGTGAQPYGFTVSPATIPFGNIPVGQASSPSNITVSNIGTQSLTITGTKMNDAAGAFIPAGFGPAIIPAGMSATIPVKCQPPTATMFSATYTFTSPQTPMFGTTTVSCTGLNTALQISPAPVNFANTIVGVSPNDQVVNIMGGTGTTTLGVTLDNAAVSAGVSMVGGNTQSFPNFTAVNVTLQYAAGMVHTGQLGTLTATVNTMNPFAVAINGQVDDAATATNPSAVEFGPVCVGDTVMKDVMVYGLKHGDVALTNVGGVQSPFMASGTGVVMGDHKNEVAVHTSVAPMMPGDAMGDMTLTFKNPSQPTQMISLHATGLAAGITGSPNPTHFGGVPAGNTTSAKQITITNCGGQDLMITDATLTGDTPDEFLIVDPQTPAATLRPTDSKTYLLVMTTHTPGAKAATLTFVHNLGTTAVDLDGTASGSTDVPTKDRETYYACSTGRPAAAWPIALALLALRRRRK